ncbi:uroporphyrinogen-III synthase [Thiomicrospira microaerophila]|uniref:uroporphyrinogen-III synthase n=1 Tax=Thiomicrospira microaerophila TaxID=406020 RepID=UPI00200EEC7F|nr:uroporphyrinogen-III synthase [Thiomicrospira microaerophila]UQB42309.1 uroporphyrinogen-III synthase [Thiomicrospira microaerophila]
MNQACLLNTRPQHQAAGLSSLIKAAGFNVIECPALRMATQVCQTPPSWSQQDVWVFVSRNAVVHFAEQLGHEPQGDARLVAVGAATAQAMIEKGWQKIEPLPQSFDSEGMLAMKVFSQPLGLKVGIVRGDGGREFLSESLGKSGAEVQFYEVYQRIIAPFCNQAWSRFKQQDQAVILFTSKSSLDAFIQQCPINDQAWYCRQPLIVFSQRIAEYARHQGFNGSIEVTANSSDQAVLDSFRLFLNRQGE